MDDLKFIQIATSSDLENGENFYGLTKDGDVYWYAYKYILRDFDKTKDDPADWQPSEKIREKVYGWKKMKMNILN